MTDTVKTSEEPKKPNITLKKPEAPARKPRFASLDQPVIEAATQGLFRCSTLEQASEWLERITQQFIISKQQPEERDESTPSIVLWIKNYERTPDEESQGFLGNYALMQCTPTDDGKYTIMAEKLETELKYHPQRKRQIHRHPNWGHPILRKIKKGRVYPSAEDVQADLQKLHEEYPDTTIPCTQKLYLMIYGKAEPGKSPVRKYVFNTKVHEDGGYCVEYEENMYTTPAPTAADKADVSADVPSGYFTSMVELRRTKKKKPNQVSKPTPRESITSSKPEEE